MQVILRKKNEASINETKTISSIQVEHAVKTVERVPGQKAAFRKFAAECNLQAQCVAQDTLANQFNAGTLQQQIASKKVDPNTLIHRAIIEHNAEVLAFLMKHHVDVDYPDANGMSPLTIAILSQQPQIVKLLLQNGAIVSPEKKWNGMSLLEISMTARDFESVKYLTLYGIDVNATFKNGKSPVEFAVCDYHKSHKWDLLNILLDSNGLSPSALDTAMVSVAPYFDQFSNDLISKLILKGANVNGEYGNALSVACICKNLERVKLLLANGANPNLCAPFHSSPLMAATDNLSIMKILIDAGANPNYIQTIKFTDGSLSENSSVLITAIHCGTADTALARVQLLVAAGADINKKINGKTPLEYAFEMGRMDVVNYLLLNIDND